MKSPVQRSGEPGGPPEGELRLNPAPHRSGCQSVPADRPRITTPRLYPTKVCSKVPARVGHGNAIGEGLQGKVPKCQRHQHG